MIVMKVGDMVVVNIGNDNFYCEKETGADIWEERARYIDTDDTLYIRKGNELMEDLTKLVDRFQEAGKIIKYMDEEQFDANKEEVSFIYEKL